MPSKKLTLFIVKPDGILLRLQRFIIAALKSSGYEIAACKVRRVTVEEVLDLYREHIGKDFFSYLVRYMTSSLSYIYLCRYSTDTDIARLRCLCGNTIPSMAGRQTIRGGFSFYFERMQTDRKVIRNFIHTSCDTAAACREIKIFFNKSELKAL